MTAGTLEPGEQPEEFSDEGAIALAERPAPVDPARPFYREVCANCRRPLIELDGRGYVHLDARIDMPTNPAFCVPELFVEPPVAWGHLDAKGKSEFTVRDSPSKSWSGFSGGGVK